MEIRAESAARDPDAATKLAARFPIKLFDRYGPVVAGTLAIGDELDAAPLLGRLAALGARIVLPRVEGNGEMTFRDALKPHWRRALRTHPAFGKAEIVGPTSC
jgi:5-formyltetrahydrofolate cyclo-ligase